MNEENDITINKDTTSEYLLNGDYSSLSSSNASLTVSFLLLHFFFGCSLSLFFVSSIIITIIMIA